MRLTSQGRLRRSIRGGVEEEQEVGTRPGEVEGASGGRGRGVCVHMREGRERGREGRIGREKLSVGK